MRQQDNDVPVTRVNRLFGGRILSGVLMGDVNSNGTSYLDMEVLS